MKSCENCYHCFFLTVTGQLVCRLDPPTVVILDGEIESASPPITADYLCGQHKSRATTQRKESAKQRARTFPTEWTDEQKSALIKAAAHYKINLRAALSSARNWAQSHDHKRVDWVATIRRGMEEGYFPKRDPNTVTRTGADGQEHTIDSRRNPTTAAIANLVNRAEAADSPDRADLPTFPSGSEGPGADD